MSALGEFCDWLAGTPPSEFVQLTPWVVPIVQSVHLLTLGIVFFLMTVFDLRVMGVLKRPASIAWSRDPLPWLWRGLVVLLISGLILVLGEPRRELFSWPFRIKMALVVIAALLTLLLSRMAMKNPSAAAKLLAGLTLVCWVLIIVAGRWVAYINFGQEEAF